MSDRIELSSEDIEFLSRRIAGRGNVSESTVRLSLSELNERRGQRHKEIQNAVKDVWAFDRPKSADEQRAIQERAKLTIAARQRALEVAASYYAASSLSASDLVGEAEILYQFLQGES